MTPCSCGQPSVAESFQGHWCKRCFLRHLEKRIRKGLNEYPSFPPQSHLHLLDDNTTGVPVARHFLTSILKKLPHTFTCGPSQPADYTITCETADQDCAAYLEAIVTNKPLPTTSTIPLLKPLLTSEVLQAAQLLNQPLKDTPPTPFERFFTRLQRKDPQIVFALATSKKKLEHA